MAWSSWPTAGDNYNYDDDDDDKDSDGDNNMTKSYDRKINSIPGRVWEELHQTGFLHFKESVL